SVLPGLGCKKPFHNGRSAVCQQRRQESDAYDLRTWLANVGIHRRPGEKVECEGVAMPENQPHRAESESGVSRRDLFNIIGAVPAAAVLTGSPAAATQAPETHQHSTAEPAPNAKGPYQRQTFNDQQWRTVRVLCDL